MSLPIRKFRAGLFALTLLQVLTSRYALGAPGVHPVTRSDNARSEAPFHYRGPSGYPNAMAIRGDSVFIGGSFKGADDVSAASLLMWDGRKWSDPFPGIPYGIMGLKWSGKRLYATGYFQEAGSDSCDQAAYWDNGSWHAMGPGLPPYDFPAPIALLGDTLVTASRSGVFRWTGSGWVPFGAALPGTPERLENFGGTLWLTGQYGPGPGLANLMRWDNGAWTTPAGTDVETVIDIAWHDNALFMLEEIPLGAFVDYRISRWDGKAWEDVTGFIPGNLGRMASNGKDFYLTYEIFNSGSGLLRWDGEAFQPENFETGDNGESHRLDFIAAGKLILSGNFTGIGRKRLDYMASWDGKAWEALSASTSPLGVSAYPTSMGTDGKQLFLGGSPIRWAGPYLASHAATFDGADWDTLGGGLRNPSDNRLVDVNVWAKGTHGM